jgi:hypothetical protein
MNNNNEPLPEWLMEPIPQPSEQLPRGIPLDKLVPGKLYKTVANFDGSFRRFNYRFFVGVAKEWGNTFIITSSNRIANPSSRNELHDLLGSGQIESFDSEHIRFYPVSHKFSPEYSLYPPRTLSPAEAEGLKNALRNEGWERRKHIVAARSVDLGYTPAPAEPAAAAPPLPTNRNNNNGSYGCRGGKCSIQGGARTRKLKRSKRSKRQSRYRKSRR